MGHVHPVLMPSTPHPRPAPGFGAAEFDALVRDALADLRRRFPFRTWMFTQKVGGEWSIVHAVPDDAPRRVVPWGDTLCAQMVAGGGPSLAVDVDDVGAYRDAPIRESVQVSAYAGVPIIDEHGRLFGTLCATNPTPIVLDAGQQREAEAAMHLFGRFLTALISVEQEREAAIRVAALARRMALHDDLTGLHNRREWARQMGRAEQSDQPVVMVSVDLDGLKEVNDTQGHAAGDELLRTAGEALLAATRRADTVARIGGDEFGVLLDGIGAEEGSRAARRIADALAASGVEASVGWSCGTGLPLAELWELADQHMYEVKQERRTRASGRRSGAR